MVLVKKCQSAKINLEVLPKVLSTMANTNANPNPKPNAFTTKNNAKMDSTTPAKTTLLEHADGCP